MQDFQPFLKFGKPFHADKVGLKCSQLNIDCALQVNVISSLEVDCLTLSAYLGQVVEGVTLHENLRYFVIKFVN